MFYVDCLSLVLFGEAEEEDEGEEREVELIDGVWSEDDEEEGGREEGDRLEEEGEGETREIEEGERETLDSLARGLWGESDDLCSLGGCGTWIIFSLLLLLKILFVLLKLAGVRVRVGVTGEGRDWRRDLEEEEGEWEEEEEREWEEEEEGTEREAEEEREGEARERVCELLFSFSFLGPISIYFCY